MKYLRYGLHVGISLLILAFLFTRVPFKRIAFIIGHSRLYLFFLSFLIGILSIYINALRWRILLKCLGYKYDLKLVLKVTFMGLFFNIYLPGGVIGDVTRIAVLPGSGDPEEVRKDHLTKVTASVVTDKFAGLAGLMLLAFTGFLFVYKFLLNSGILIVFGSVAFAVSIIFFTLFSRRTQRFIKKIFAFPLKILSPVKAVLKEVTEVLFVYRDNYSVFNKVIPLSVFGHLCVVCYFFLLARSIDVNISFLMLLAFVPVIEFVSTLPISVGGAGVREVATILLFSSAGIPAVKSMSVSLLSFVIVLLLGAIGGFFYLCRQTGSNRTIQC